MILRDYSEPQQRGLDMNAPCPTLGWPTWCCVTDRSVTDTCFDIGFESLGSFSTLFKTRLGVSPALYRTSYTSTTQRIPKGEKV